MIEVLREPHRKAVVNQTEEAAGEAEAPVRLVLRARRGIAPSGQAAARDVPLRARRAEGTDGDDQHALHERQPEEDLDRARANQRRDQGLDEPGEWCGGLIDWHTEDDMVDDDLDRPGQCESRKQREDRQADLDAEALPEGQRIAERAA